MSTSVLGPLEWSMQSDNDGHRDYFIRFLAESTDPEDGPAMAFTATGLPMVGAPWDYGNDNDPDAFCWPDFKVQPVVIREPNIHWTVDCHFSTKSLKRCQDTAPGNPISEPQQISGSFVKYVKALEQDANGLLILSSSHEPIKGLERDANRPSVVVEQNVLSLGLATFTAMIDTTNDATLWGLGAGKIKLSNISWARKLYGSCNYYYTRRFEFDIRYEGFDIVDVADAGYKKFDTDRYADTAPNRADPTKYVLIKDGRGENTPQKVLLDGNGSPLTDPTSPVFLAPIQVYGMSNFTTLGIPTTL